MVGSDGIPRCPGREGREPATSDPAHRWQRPLISRQRAVLRRCGSRSQRRDGDGDAGVVLRISNRASSRLHMRLDAVFPRGATREATASHYHAPSPPHTVGRWAGHVSRGSVVVRARLPLPLPLPVALPGLDIPLGALRERVHIGVES
jgi:hypothetical protein